MLEPTGGPGLQLALREQVHRDGSWVSLLVAKPDRPSLPLEKRMELRRQFMENASKSAPSRDRLDRWRAATKEIQEWSSPAGTIMQTFFGFEGPPQTCLEAVGDLYFERSAIRFRL